MKNILLFCIISMIFSSGAFAADEPTMVVAGFDFSAIADPDKKIDGLSTENYAEQLSLLTYENLSKSPALTVVDRSQLDKVMRERALNQSGLVPEEQAIAIAGVLGAKILILGKLINSDSGILVSTKLIDTETTIFLPVSVNAPYGTNVNDIAKNLASEIISTLKNNKEKFSVKKTNTDTLTELQKLIPANAKKPSVTVNIYERHIGNNTNSDSAAQTELQNLLTELGFIVIDGTSDFAKTADIKITGEGISEYATRNGELISSKSRLEIRAVSQKSGQLISADRQTSTAVDLSEVLAGKKALQQAASKLSIRLIPKLIAKEGI